jgi:hypothetical protein
MPKLFVEQPITIHAPASSVWDVMTNPLLAKCGLRSGGLTFSY